MSRKHTFVILGMGSRGKNAYGAELARMPDRAQITAVADPDPERLSIGGEAFGVRPGMRYSSAEELLAQPRLAEVACVWMGPETAKIPEPIREELRREAVS